MGQQRKLASFWQIAGSLLVAQLLLWILLGKCCQLPAETGPPPSTIPARLGPGTGYVEFAGQLLTIEQLRSIYNLLGYFLEEFARASNADVSGAIAKDPPPLEDPELFPGVDSAPWEWPPTSAQAAAPAAPQAVAAVPGVLSLAAAVVRPPSAEEAAAAEAAAEAAKAPSPAKLHKAFTHAIARGRLAMGPGPSDPRKRKVGDGGEEAELQMFDGVELPAVGEMMSTDQMEVLQQRLNEVAQAKYGGKAG